MSHISQLFDRRIEADTNPADTLAGDAARREIDALKTWHEADVLAAFTGLSPEAIGHAVAAGARWNVPAHRALLAVGLMSDSAYSAALARWWGVATVGESLTLIPAAPIGDIAGEPIYRIVVDSVVMAAVPADAASPAIVLEAVPHLSRRGLPVAFAPTRRLQAAAEQATRRSRFIRATFGLARQHPELSAARGLDAWQQAALTFIVASWIGAALVLPHAAAAALLTLLTFAFAGIVSIRLTALALSLRSRGPAPAPPALGDDQLPTYAVMVPIFDEATVLPALVETLSRLDYPAAKLDICLIFEEADLATKAALLRIALPPTMRTVVVPDGVPRTKPKALNYALQSVHADLVVVYDAEDRPEPDQLRKAAAAFHHSAANLACVQACLNIYNPLDSWFSRQFTVEYSALFDAILPALVALDLPVPLGGTSNHFPRRVLEEVGGWDAFNMTEDADLGVRLRRLGYTTAMLASTTWEEAPVTFGQWWRQRTRWLKGWFQTYGVHTRRPFRLVRDFGLLRAAGFHLYFGGLILSALVQPLFFAALALEAAFGPAFALPADFGGPWLAGLAIANLVVGYAAAIIVALIAVRRRRHRLILSALALPLCWLLISFAAYRALWQLWRAPFLWEKTRHGLARTPRRPVRRRAQ